MLLLATIMQKTWPKHLPTETKEYLVLANEVLGSGGQGTVFKGIWKSTNSFVAIKIIPKHAKYSKQEVVLHSQFTSAKHVVNMLQHKVSVNKL